MPSAITLCDTLGVAPLRTLLARFGLAVVEIPAAAPIPGTFWGEPEAGLIGDQLYLRGDTPVHSALHEACHYICMDSLRRSGLHTNAGGGYDEENAVCYLQILLADYLPPLNKSQLMADMDSWGYSFRLGSAHAWFSQDAEDARQWLRREGLLDTLDQPTWRRRA
jgi:hypothetical protein